MREEQKAYIFTCDAPKCDGQVVMLNDELADGFHGKVLEIGSFGGRDAEWYACRATHIREAVEGALAKANEQ